MASVSSAARGPGGPIRRGLALTEPLKAPPSVRDQLTALGLEGMYFGYQVSSAYVHGSLASAAEIATVRKEGSPYGDYWPIDWYLAVRLCALGCVLVAQYYPFE